MIGFLKGTMLLKDAPYILLNVHDVGYKVHVSQNMLTQYHVGDLLEVFTHTHVREDALDLYGFATLQALKLFELLLSVSGIGPKTAIGVFTLGNESDIIAAIRKADTAFFTGVPRLGKKNAQKIIIELKNKMGSTGELDLSGSEEKDEVTTALMSMGFTTSEARDAVRLVGKEGKTVSETIRLALKQLGK